MQRREFIAALGTAAAVVSASPAIAAQTDYPDFMKDGSAKAEEKGATEREQMHPAKYASLEKSSIKCVETGNDCLRHCFGMFSMKDTSMAACADTTFQLVAACNGLASLAAVNSPHVPSLAMTVEKICLDCKKECDIFPDVVACKACGDACQNCADECRKLAA
jgi:Cys-rich four helix bundle protein (predicted Tat secretion target)